MHKCPLDNIGRNWPRIESFCGANKEKFHVGTTLPITRPSVCPALPLLAPHDIVFLEYLVVKIKMKDVLMCYLQNTDWHKLDTLYGNLYKKDWLKLFCLHLTFNQTGQQVESITLLNEQVSKHWPLVSISRWSQLTFVRIY